MMLLLRGLLFLLASTTSIVLAFSTSSFSLLSSTSSPTSYRNQVPLMQRQRKQLQTNHPSSTTITTGAAGVSSHCLWAAKQPSSSTTTTTNSVNDCDSKVVVQNNVDRRTWFRKTGIAIAAATTTATSMASPIFGDMTAFADSILTTPSSSSSTTMLEMKTFVDPVGYFAITIPKKFFAIRREAKGDLPNAKTGQGRRGSSIFTAGDMAKAEVLAIERFPVSVLLEENGMAVTAADDLSLLSKIGSAQAVANLVLARREKEKNIGGSITTMMPSFQYLQAPTFAENGKVLTFAVKTELEVQKPELLMETYGVSQLFRITLAKVCLDRSTSNSGSSGEEDTTSNNIMAVFASALEQDFNGPDGVALQQAVDSFTVTTTSSGI